MKGYYALLPIMFESPSQHCPSSLLPRPINFKPPRESSRFVAAFSGGYHTWIVHESKRIFGFGLNNWWVSCGCMCLDPRSW